ncbi:MAG: ABC transporter substrate-binding protein [Alphaproteobacteria bacterium]|uniref:ABC transporter substrate-binding protein n=1 Tax=Candidatus Nitrobium versatile TaxID=2884831 RepID=A0A953J5T1_9BACT|nr:ABC transporter substrate-binding protein [Candidatus Nitrobium versatile]
MKGLSGRKVFGGWKTIGLCIALAVSLLATAAFADVELKMPKGKSFTDHHNVNLKRIIYTPLASYRVGPYAAGGTGYYGGEIDLFKWINLKYGGINGIPIVWDECETEWDTPRGVECYERYKNKGPYGATANDPLSVGIAYALQEKTQKDKIPSITPNHGNTASQDGRIFPYQFPLEITPYDEANIMVKYVGQTLGGMDKLRGKKIAVLYHGSAYGRETIGFHDTMAKQYGYQLQQIEVAHPGNEQMAIWLNVKRWNPDFVFLRGWGVMVPVALKTAAKVGYPVKKIIGNIWSNSEADVVPAGAAAKGYVTINTQAPGRNWPLIQTLWKDLYEGKLTGKNEGNMADKDKVGSVYYNLGVVAGIFHVEAMRVAMAKFGKDIPLNGQYKRYGLENLNLTDEKLKEYGVYGMMQNVKTSCKDHTGGHKAKFAQWDGKQFRVITNNWIEADQDQIWKLIYERSEKYAKENGVTPRDCNNPKDVLYDLAGAK